MSFNIQKCIYFIFFIIISKNIFSDYKEEENKKRYYKKGTNIDKKLEKIYIDSIQNNNTEAIYNLLVST